MVCGLLRASKSNPKDDSAPKNILHLQLKSFAFTGIRAPENIRSSSRKLLAYNIYTAFVVIIYIPSLAGQTVVLYMSTENIAGMTAVAFPTIAGYLHFFISSYLLFKRKPLEQIVMRTEESFAECRSKLPLTKEHNLITEDATKKIRLYSWIFFITNMVTWLLWVSLPLVFRLSFYMQKQERLALNGTETDDEIRWEFLCYKLWLPRPVFQEPYYHLVWAYQTFLVSILLVNNAAYNSTYYALTIFIAAHFKVVAALIEDIDQYIRSPHSKNNPKRLSTWLDMENENLLQYGKSLVKEIVLNNSDFSDRENNQNGTLRVNGYLSLNQEGITTNLQQAEDYLINCIKYHQALLRYVEEVGGVFSNLLFIFFSLNGALMCITVFQASVSSGETGSFKFLGALITVWVPMFLICWFGELLTQESGAVERAIYGCKWYNASERFKKYVQFVIMRSQKVVRLSAGNFFAISLGGFASITNTVYAYYNLLIQAQE